MIHAEVTDVKEKVLSFPKLMIGSVSGMVVLMSEPKVGTILLRNGCPYPSGEHRVDFAMDYLTDFTSTISLSNKEV